MSFKVRQLSPVEVLAQERIYLARDGSPVHEGDPRAVSLLVAKDNIISTKVAQRYGLLEAKQPTPPKTTSPEDIESRSTRPGRADSRRG